MIRHRLDDLHACATPDCARTTTPRCLLCRCRCSAGATATNLPENSWFMVPHDPQRLLAAAQPAACAFMAEAEPQHTMRCTAFADLPPRQPACRTKLMIWSSRSDDQADQASTIPRLLTLFVPAQILGGQRHGKI